MKGVVNVKSAETRERADQNGAQIYHALAKRPAHLITQAAHPELRLRAGRTDFTGGDHAVTWNARARGAPSSARHKVVETKAGSASDAHIPGS